MLRDTESVEKTLNLEEVNKYGEDVHEDNDGAGIGVNAGHGINYENVRAMFAVPHLNELNIGHSIVSRAITVGLGQATGEMLEQMVGYDAG